MSEKKTVFVDKIKKVIGVEPGTKLFPMISYNSAIFLSGGAFYIIGCYFLPFLTKVEGLSAAQYSVVVLFATLCDAITDPVMGVITDRTRHRNGRHRPYIIWGVIPAMISYFMMWNSFGISSKGNTTMTMVYYILVYMLFKTVYTFVIVPHTAMLPEIAPEYSLRTQYNAVKTIMDAVASYSSFIISALFFGFFETEKFSPASRSKFSWMGAILCLWVSLPLIFTYKFTREKSSLGEPREPFSIREFAGRYGNIFRNRAFRLYFAFGFFTMLSSCFVSTTSYYFLENVMRQEGSYNMITTVSGIAEAVGFFPAYIFSIKKSKQLPAKVFIPVAAAALMLTWFIDAGSPKFFMFIVNFLYGLGLAGMASVQSNIFPDVTDVDEMITGERREGTISTFSTFVKKFVNGFASLGVGLLLSAFGFDTQLSAAEQTGVALKGLRISYSVVPIVFFAMAVAVIYRYRMGREEHALMKRAIAEKKETGKASLTEEEIKTLEDISGHSFTDMWIGK
ncbi:MAG: MFS transporter [Clostridiales bacterium]|nr:MFS transporter [Clostridiales bacterium]